VTAPAQTAPARGIVRRQPGEPRLLSLGQQRLWFLDQLNPASPTYNCPLLIRVEGPLNIEALQKAHDAFVMRHEALRTVCLNRGGTPVAALLRRPSVPLRIYDLRNLRESEREAEASCIADQEANRPFNLARDVLFNASIIRLSEESFLLVYSFSHMAFEGTSIPIMCNELAQLYGGFVSGRPVELPALPFQYCDFVLWQTRNFEGSRLERLREYWKKQLAGVKTVLSLPTDFPRPALQSFIGKRYRWHLPSDLLAAANDFFRVEGTTPFRGWCAAFNVLLWSYTGQEEILLGSPFIPPMLPPGVEKLVGFFVNTVVLRNSVAGNPNFRDLLARIDQTVRGATKHAEFDFDHIVQLVNPPRDPSRPSIFQVNFRVAPTPFPVLQLPGLKVSRPVYMDTGTSKFDLALDIEASEGSCYFEYTAALFRESTVLQMTQDLQNVMRDLLQTPGIPITQLPSVLEVQKRIQRAGVIGPV